MAQFELNIYGENDEIVKKYETDVVRWKVFMQALEFYNGKEGRTAEEQFAGINSFVKMIFNALTDEELENASVDDVLNTFNQLIVKARKIGGAAKNPAGAG